MFALTNHWKRSHCSVGWTLVLWVLRVLFYHNWTGVSLRKMIVLQILHMFNTSEISVSSCEL
jgi:hypothetical protein